MSGKIILIVWFKENWGANLNCIDDICCIDRMTCVWLLRQIFKTFLILCFYIYALPNSTKKTGGSSKEKMPYIQIKRRERNKERKEGRQGRREGREEGGEKRGERDFIKRDTKIIIELRIEKKQMN